MDKKIIQTKAYDLTMIKDKKFKTFMIRAVLRYPFDETNITMCSLLCAYLTYSTKKYKTKLEMINHARDLYGTYVNSYINRIGNNVNMNIIEIAVNSKYVDIQLFKESIILLNDVIFNPNFQNNKCNSMAFSNVKTYLKTLLEDIKDEQIRYTDLKMLSKMGKNKPYSYNIDGNLKDLKGINEIDLYNFYNDFIRKCGVDIYIAGDIQYEEIEDLFKEYFKGKHQNKSFPSINYQDSISKKEKVYMEKSNFGQSKLSIGCKIDCDDMFKYGYAVLVYNVILGGSPAAKLFLNVREKLSCAYYINSRCHLADKNLIINSGIKRSNFDKVIDEIKFQMNEIKIGNITNKELESAKKECINSFKELDDDIFGLTNYVINQKIIGHEDIEIQIKKLSKITIDDIIEVAKMIKIDTIFLLEEGVNNETVKD